MLPGRSCKERAVGGFSDKHMLIFSMLRGEKQKCGELNTYWVCHFHIPKDNFLRIIQVQ